MFKSVAGNRVAYSTSAGQKTQFIDDKLFPENHEALKCQCHMEA